MKYIILLTFFTLASFSSFAQSVQQKEVADAVELLRKAMISGNKQALESATADSLSYGHSNGHVENKEEFVSTIASGKSTYVSIELSEQTISITRNIAVVRHILNAVTKDNGIPGSLKLKVLLVFEKEKGRWKLLARQAVKLV